ncbi:MAG: pyridoxine 5'-phosphate synthase [Flavobacteriales bacterium]|nr:pyridoxine 5'-phosphate synthase [Flavobacteriales bacterium]MDW8432300.1 pyridoxine 5'-phosphate synthase [Flavobacteriales bacterium]
MVRLSVNINKIATLRNARGGRIPDVVAHALAIEDFGADGITVHPRPDERHIKRQDVYDLRQVLRKEFNVEGYPSENFLKMMEEVKPTQVTLVPDPPHVLTSNTGWNCRTHQDFLKDVVARLKSIPLRVSLFLNPEPDQVEWAQKTGADAVELYTEPYASAWNLGENSGKKALEIYETTARLAAEAGLQVHAGHDLNLQNLSWLAHRIPGLTEVSIGHALIADALWYGLQNTVALYKRCLQPQNA